MKPDYTFKGVGLISGYAEGKALVGNTRISFWGGFDPKTGVVLQDGVLKDKNVSNKILLFISSKGSSGTSSRLALAKFEDNHPLALINTEIDELAVLAAEVCNIPMVGNISEEVFDLIENDDFIKINGETGTIEVYKKN